MMLATKRHKKAQKINKTTYLRVLRAFVVKNRLTVTLPWKIRFQVDFNAPGVVEPPPGISTWRRLITML
jgi:hypothetical protein